MRESAKFLALPFLRGSILTSVSDCIRSIFVVLASYCALELEHFLLVLCLLSLVISFVFRGISQRFPGSRQWDLIVTSLLFFHVVFGVGLNFYERVPLFDKILHLLGTFFIGLAVWKTLVVHPVGPWISRSLPFLFLLVTALGFALGGVWEILEFLIDSMANLPRPAQIDLCDTMCDLIADLIGSVFAAGAVCLYARKQGLSSYA